MQNVIVSLLFLAAKQRFEACCRDSGSSRIDLSACFDVEHGTIRIGPKDSRHYRNLSDYTITEDDAIAEKVFGYVPLSGRKQKNVLACLHACYALNRDGDGPNVRSSQPRITITLKPFY
jgi:hypothetical protein